VEVRKHVKTLTPFGQNEALSDVKVSGKNYALNVVRGMVYRD
jgi:hypothetical protein